jgi:hypothetical protein
VWQCIPIILVLGRLKQEDHDSRLVWAAHEEKAKQNKAKTLEYMQREKSAILNVQKNVVISIFPTVV